MNRPARFLLLVVPLVLAGCLEVEQHPAWRNGQYAGKRDQQPYQARFHNDRLSWWAAIANRGLGQNEYNRSKP